MWEATAGSRYGPWHPTGMTEAHTEAPSSAAQTSGAVKPGHAWYYSFPRLASVHDYDERKHFHEDEDCSGNKSRAFPVTAGATLESSLQASHRPAQPDLHPSQGSWGWLSDFGIAQSPHLLLFYGTSSFPAVCLYVVFSLFKCLKLKCISSQKPCCSCGQKGTRVRTAVTCRAWLRPGLAFNPPTAFYLHNYPMT